MVELARVGSRSVECVVERVESGRARVECGRVR